MGLFNAIGKLFPKHTIAAKLLTKADNTIGKVVNNIPIVGTVGNILDSLIPAKTQTAMATAATAAGFVDTSEVAKTIVEQGVNLSDAVPMAQQLAVEMGASLSLPVVGDAVTCAASATTGFMSLLQKYWYAFAGGVVILIVLLFVLFGGKKKRRGRF